MGATSERERRIELYVRSLAPGGTHRQQDTVVRRLDDLLRESAIDDYDVRVWGDRICHASASARTADGRHVQDRLARIERWADEEGRSLDGVYREVHCDSAITEESWTEVRFPEIALAEFVDDQLVHLAPSHDEDADELVRVTDRLADLADETPVDVSGTTAREDEASDGGGDSPDDQERRRIEAGHVDH
ncbi:HTH domain-containing protein [Halomarina salina]|uniref:HTH domain-containing protein n=1 Tax=Halomarina salina TaxID=1872699 RepID=A0ABD5RR07_9EURY|nr:HTH domain-containing protein [Halomarina salina]